MNVLGKIFVNLFFIDGYVRLSLIIVNKVHFFYYVCWRK